MVSDVTDNMFRHICTFAVFKNQNQRILIYYLFSYCRLLITAFFPRMRYHFECVLFCLKMS